SRGADPEHRIGKRQRRELVGHRQRHACTRGAKRMPNRQRTAVHVEDLLVDVTDPTATSKSLSAECITLQGACDTQTLGGKGLVQVNPVHVSKRQPCTLERFWNGNRRTDQQLV